jgi:hypothetical protein
VSTLLDADETLRELNGTIGRMNGALDDFDAALTGFSDALNNFIEAIERFDGVVARVDTVLMPRVDAIVGKAEGILSGTAIPAMGAHVIGGLRRSVAGVAAVAGVRGRSHGGER